MQASAQTAQAPQIKLLLGIVVEGLDDGSLEMLRESFGEGGFRYLYRNGVYLPQADFGTQLDATSATALLVSGAQPALNGVDAESHFDRDRLLPVHVYADKDVNVVGVSDKVKRVMESSAFTIHASLSYDRAEEQMKEFRTLVLRSSLTLVILLMFVWMCGGFKWRYLTVITVSLLANILIAVMFYRLFDIRLHPFSMAGITVSLGIIIDSAIVMADLLP